MVAQNVGIGTISPKASFNVAAGKTVLFGADTSGAGSKLIWYPSKSAFRVGIVDAIHSDYWDSYGVGVGSFATGINNEAYWIGATAMGELNNAGGPYATAIGYGNWASGSGSSAIGRLNSSYGAYSHSIGTKLIAQSFGEIVLGNSNTDYNPLSFTEWNVSDRLFVIGNGTDGETGRQDAIVILKNGNTGIGTSTPTEKLEVAGNIKTSTLQVTAAAAKGSVLTSDAKGNAFWSVPATNSWATTENNNIYNNNSANVGIGTIAPDSRLTVAGNTAVPQIKIYQGTGTDFARLRLTNVNGNTDNRFWDIAGIIDAEDGSGDRLNFFNVTGGNVLSLTGNGNAGIGTAAPKSTLEVNGAFATTVTYRGTAVYRTILDNSATVWIFIVSAPLSTAIDLPDPTGCPNRRYTLVNRNNYTFSITSYVDLSGNPATVLPALGSIELISGGVAWEQIK